MNDISVCTIYAKRKLHLHNLVKGLMASKLYPDELVVVCMNDRLPNLPATPFAIRSVNLNSDCSVLPLATARNKAAAMARGEKLIFLDVDCISDRNLIGVFNYHLDSEDFLYQGSVRYLHSDWQKDNWTFTTLQAQSSVNKLQGEAVTGNNRIKHPYELFWSLCFGIRKKTFFDLGGFDTDYLGYGGEDTDFAFTARSHNLPLYKVSALAYHQFHASYSPPLNHLAEIVNNARLFYQKWQILPMEKWLKKFADLGYVELKRDRLEIIKYPTAAEIEQFLI